RLSDDILADAAAGSDYIKLRRDAHFTQRDLALLEVHEGWVHLGTTLNGQRQPVCSFLSKGTPATTRTQEGLAVLAELLAGAGRPTSRPPDRPEPTSCRSWINSPTTGCSPARRSCRRHLATPPHWPSDWTNYCPHQPPFRSEKASKPWPHPW